jgi:hypothetical protein
VLRCTAAVVHAYADYAPSEHEADWVNDAFAEAGTNTGTNLSESEPTSEDLKASQDRGVGVSRPGSLKLWSRRSGVRIPSLTPYESPVVAGDSPAERCSYEERAAASGYQFR